MSTESRQGRNFALAGITNPFIHGVSVWTMSCSTVNRMMRALPSKSSLKLLTIKPYTIWQLELNMLSTFLILQDKKSRHLLCQKGLKSGSFKLRKSSKRRREDVDGPSIIFIQQVISRRWWHHFCLRKICHGNLSWDHRIEIFLVCIVSLKKLIATGYLLPPKLGIDFPIFMILSALLASLEMGSFGSFHPDSPPMSLGDSLMVLLI